jgi:carbon starvation protein
MFEALFILTTIDAGTRIARFLVQEAMGKAHPKLGRPDWLPANLLASALVVAAWSYFIFTGSIDTIWPMFGIANQLLAVVALCVGTTFLINRGRARYAWVTLVPMCVIATTTLSAGALSLTDIFWPMTSRPGFELRGWINTVVTALMMGFVATILIDTVPKWVRTLRTGTPPAGSIAAQG